MELHERIVTTKPAVSHGSAEGAFRRPQELDPHARHQRARTTADRPGDRPRRNARPRHRGHPPAPLGRDGHLPRRPRAAHERDRRRHPRLRPARAAPRPTTRSRRSWSTARARSGSSVRAASTRRPCASRDDSHLRRIINRMVAQIGRRIDESSPMVDARLPDGSRVNAIIAPLSLSGPLLTIRKFSRKRLGLQDMVNIGSLSARSRSTSCGAASWRSSTSSSRAVRARGRRRC